MKTHFLPRATLHAFGLMFSFSCAFLNLEAQTATNVVHTLVYHQITAFSANALNISPVAYKLSREGQHLVCATNILGQTCTNVVLVMNPDGTGVGAVDTYAAWGPCDTLWGVDITDGGAEVISTDGVQLRIANGNGAGGKTLIAFSDITQGISSIRIAGDGSKVFFLLASDKFLPGAQSPMARGLWVINPDGSGLRQVASLSAVATVLGVTNSPTDHLFFGTTHFGLDVSTNGSHVVFSTYNLGGDPSGNALLGVNLDGTGLHAFPLGATYAVEQVAISPDGSKAAYGYRPGACCSSAQEAGVFNFDGSGRQVLSTNTGSDSNGLRMQFSDDVAWFLVGGALYNSDGSGVYLLLYQFNSSAFEHHVSVLDSDMRGMTMNGGASRFLHLTDTATCAGCPNLPVQLITLDLDPPSLGVAPAITESQVDPDYLLTQERSSIAVSARVTPTNTLAGVGYQILSESLQRIDFADAPMTDVAGDGVFTHAGSTSQSATVGPRLFFIAAELVAADGRRHATVVQMAPFSVLAQPPPAVPQLTTQPQSQIVVTGANAMFTVGASGSGPLSYQWFLNQVPIPGATTATFTLTNLNGAEGGYYTVAVSNPAGTVISAPASLTVISLRMYAGITLDGIVGRNYRIDYVTNLSNTTWTTLTAFTLQNSPYLYIDTQSSTNSRRFYRAVLLP